MHIKENSKAILAAIKCMKLSNTPKFILQSLTKQEKTKKILPGLEEEKK